MNRIKDKTKEIDGFLSELKEIMPSSFDEYKSSTEKKAACERYVEKIIEAVTDLAFLIIKYKKLKIPEDDIEAFDILLDNKIIDKDLASKLKDAKGMRNIIAHQYGKIDDKIVFDAVTKELEEDVNKFIEEFRNMVYEPKEDSFLMQKHIEKYAKGIVLDIGTGTGILAEEAASSKKVVKVFGVDINEEAIKYCIRNQKSKKIIYAMSDLFSLFKIDRRYIGTRFDTIIFNPPYLPNDPNVKDKALDGGKKGYELICKFLHESKRFLKPKGKILVVFSSLTGKEKLDNFLIDNYWNFKELEKKHIFFEDLYVYVLNRKI